MLRCSPGSATFPKHIGNIGHAFQLKNKDDPMIKSIVLSALMTSLLAGAAFAQATPPAKEAPPAAAQSAPAPATGATPENPDQCLKTASDLAQSAEDRKLGEEKLDKIEDLLTKMETHCDAKQFVEAMNVAKDIKSIIETQ